MRRTITHTAAALSMAGALAVTGCGGSETAATTGSATQGTQQGAPPQGARGGFDVAALADAIGVSESKLRDAMEEIGMGAGGPPAGGAPPDGATPPDGTPPSGGAAPTGPPAGGPPAGGPGGGAFAEQLADALGVSEKKVEQAFEDVMPAPPAAEQAGSAS